MFPIATYLMVLKAPHVLMCSDAVRAEEIGTVGTACNCLLLGLAARTHNLLLLDGAHVEGIHHHIVHGQTVYSLRPHPGHLLADGTHHRLQRLQEESIISRLFRLHLLINTFRTKGVQTAQNARLLERVVTYLTQVLLVDLLLGHRGLCWRVLSGMGGRWFTRHLDRVTGLCSLDVGDFLSTV